MLKLHDAPAVPRLLFRWNQPRRPWKHCEAFAAGSAAELLASAAAAHDAFAPPPAHPLYLQSPTLAPDRQVGRKVVWAALPGPLGGEMWPWQPAAAGRELAARAADLFDLACRRLLPPAPDTKEVDDVRA